MLPCLLILAISFENVVDQQKGAAHITPMLTLRVKERKQSTNPAQRTSPAHWTDYESLTCCAKECNK